MTHTLRPSGAPSQGGPGSEVLQLVAEQLESAGLISQGLLRRVTGPDLQWAANTLSETLLSLSQATDDLTAASYTVLRAVAILALWDGFLAEGGVTTMAALPGWLYRYMKERPTVFEPRECGSVGVVVPTLEPDKAELAPLMTLAALPGWRVYIVGGWEPGRGRILEGIPGVEAYRVEGRDSPAKSRNIGLELALDRGAEVVVFADSDTILTPLEARHLASYACPGSVLASPLAVSIGGTPYDAFHDYDGAINGALAENGLLYYATTFALAVNRGLLDAGLRFSEEYPISAGEDVDFSLEAIRMGATILSLDQVVVPHDYGYTGPESLKFFIERYRRYGRGNAILLRRKPYYYTGLTMTRTRRTHQKPNPVITMAAESRVLGSTVRRVAELAARAGGSG